MILYFSLCSKNIKQVAFPIQLDILILTILFILNSIDLFSMLNNVDKSNKC